MDDSFHDQNAAVPRNKVHLSHATQAAEISSLPITDDLGRPMMNVRLKTSQLGSTKPASGQLSKETWEGLKPIIHTLYMGDGGSLARVTQYLRDEYGFLPTKQLTQRFQAWGFRKNLPRKSQNFVIGEVSKLKRSKPRMKRLKSSALSSEGTYFKTNDEPIDDDMNRWPFADLDLDLIGSPGLSRLVEALELETYGEVPALDLPPPVVLNATTLLPRVDPQAVRLELLTANKSPKSPTAKASYQYSMGVITQADARQLPARYTWSSKFDPFSLLLSFSQHQSPLNELDLFPASATSSGLRSNWQLAKGSVIVPYTESLYAIVAALYPSEDPHWPQMLKLQADSYFDTKQFKQAETLYRKLLICYERTIGAHSIPAFDVSRKIAMTLFHQGKYQRAYRFYQSVHAQIIAQFPAEHLIVQDSITLKSGIVSFAGDFDEEAMLSRQLAQIDLCHYGPRHKNTMESLRGLAVALQNTGYTFQSEKLLYTVLQLFRSNISQWQYIDKENYGRAFQNLCKTIYMQERYDDCEKLCLEAIQEVKPLLGINHDITLCLTFRLATIWKKRGIRHAECEALLRDILQRQRTFYAAVTAATVDTIQELAELLTTLGRHHEATEFYEQMFWNDLDTYGPDHSYTFGSFTQLGASYDCERRHDDALLLATDYMKQIGKLKGKDDPTILQVNEWLDKRLERSFQHEDDDIEQPFSMGEESRE